MVLVLVLVLQLVLLVDNKEDRVFDLEHTQEKYALQQRNYKI